MIKRIALALPLLASACAPYYYARPYRPYHSYSYHPRPVAPVIVGPPPVFAPPAVVVPRPHPRYRYW